MEDILNKTENKTQTDFSNIREMQNLVKTNSINSFAANLKMSKQKLSTLGSKILEIKKANESMAAESKTEKQPKVAPVSSPVAEKPQTSAQNANLQKHTLKKKIWPIIPKKHTIWNTYSRTGWKNWKESPTEPIMIWVIIRAIKKN